VRRPGLTVIRMARQAHHERLLVLALALMGCASARPPPEPADDLAGRTFALESQGPVRFEVAGSVQGAPATVELELAQPLTTVTRGCFAHVPDSDRTVRVQRVPGGLASFKEISLRGAHIGNAHLGTLRAGLVEEGGPCRLTVGSDVLGAYALRLSVAERTLTLEKPVAREAALVAVPKYESAAVLELTRDPQNDWPLLPVQLRQGGARLTGPFALSTIVPHTQVSGHAAQAAGLSTTSALLDALHLPVSLPVPPQLGADLVVTDALALTPELAVADLPVKLRSDWTAQSPVGVLGSDAWGRFDALIDLQHRYLLLARPRLSGADDHGRCEGPEGASEEACFALTSTASPHGPRVTATVWRDLPRGARVYLDVLDSNGQPLGRGCRVGFSFLAGTRGASMAHAIPWPRLETLLPGCADLSRAASFRLGGLDDGPMSTCLGNCAFAEDLHKHQAVCSCEGGGEGGFAAAAALMQRFGNVLHRPPPQAPEQEPPDPGDYQPPPPSFNR
jgi:hypothetical protein